jgi:hypothetical protein
MILYANIVKVNRPNVERIDATRKNNKVRKEERKEGYECHGNHENVQDSSPPK